MIFRMLASSDRISQILAHLLEQLGMLVAQLLLLQIDELTERHPQDRVGLHGGEAIFIGHAALVLKDAKTFGAQGPLHHRGRSGDAHQADLGLGQRARWPE